MGTPKEEALEGHQGQLPKVYSKMFGGTAAQAVAPNASDRQKQATCVWKQDMPPHGVHAEGLGPLSGMVFCTPWAVGSQHLERDLHVAPDRGRFRELSAGSRHQVAIIGIPVVVVAPYGAPRGSCLALNVYGEHPGGRRAHLPWAGHCPPLSVPSYRIMPLSTSRFRFCPCELSKPAQGLRACNDCSLPALTLVHHCQVSVSCGA